MNEIDVLDFIQILIWHNAIYQNRSLKNMTTKKLRKKILKAGYDKKLVKEFKGWGF